MKLLKKTNRGGEYDSLSQQTSMAIGSALAVALHKAGWELRASPGEPVYAQQGEQKIEPFEVLGRLVSRKLSAEQWRAQCATAGIASVDLGTLVTE